MRTLISAGLRVLSSANTHSRAPESVRQSFWAAPEDPPPRSVEFEPTSGQTLGRDLLESHGCARECSWPDSRIQAGPSGGRTCTADEELEQYQNTLEVVHGPPSDAVELEAKRDDSHRRIDLAGSACSDAFVHPQSDRLNHEMPLGLYAEA